MTRKDAERQEAIGRLREWIKPGETVYTVLRHVSRSGMQRVIGIVLIHKDENGDPIDLHPNWAVSKALDYRLSDSWKDGVVANGCGMDMGFEVVYNLGRLLFGDGYALKHRWL